MGELKHLRSNKLYQFKITLNYIRPPIWRRFIVQSDIKLPAFHNVIQKVMDWEDAHLHMFHIENKLYGPPDDDDMIEFIDYRKIRLNKVVTREKQKFIYDYDFGDCWEHTLVLEKILDKTKEIKTPVCVAGKRRTPPEDCGGPPGYGDLLEILQDPNHPAHEDMMDWLGGEIFDPEEFDIDRINKQLRR